MDKNKILSILNDWNYWEKPLPKFIPREYYQNKISTYLRSGEIIILKGIRRSGKSTLLLNHINHLLENGLNIKEILFVNFEDPRFNGELNASLLEQIFEVYKEFICNEKKPHVFLDEVQNVKQWEKWVLTGYELNKASFYITGSSSKLLSKEFGTALSGRHLDINVFPLSFKEYLLFQNIKYPDKKTIVTNRLVFKRFFNSYVKTGGFPKILFMDDELRKEEIIMYYETIILKDIVARYNLKSYENVKKVALFLLSNIGKPLNLNKVRTSIRLSYDLADKYFEYLKDSYLLSELFNYDFSLKKQFAKQRKVYCIDNGILSNTSFRISEDYGRYLENLVFVELIRRGNEVYFYSDKKECDFLLKKGTKIISAIQVTRTLQDKKTMKRELDGLIEALNAHQLNEGMILTDDEEDLLKHKHYKINILPVWKWLLS